MARTAKEHFDNLYLIVDQRSCAILVRRLWIRGGLANSSKARQSKYFVFDQFALTAAEQYLVDEFATQSACGLGLSGAGNDSVP